MDYEEENIYGGGEEDYFFEEKEQNIVSAFRDRERIGFSRGLATAIEGQGHLSQYLNKLNRMDPELKAISLLEGFYYEVYPIYGSFGVNDLDNIINIFNRSENKLCKSPVLFVLGYIMNQTETRTGVNINLIRRLIDSCKLEYISEIDVIRYYRMIKRLT
jgi:hypothetical protein